MTPPLRILTIAPLPPTVTGGIEEYAYSVVDALRSSGADVTVLTTSDVPFSAGTGPTVLVPAIDLLSRPVCVDPMAYVRTIPLLRRADAVHVHMPFPGFELFAAFVAKVLGKPVVVTYHMDVVVDVPERGGPRHLLHRLVERVYSKLSAALTLDLATVVCTNTRAYALQSPLLRPRLEKVSIVHQGIDAQKLAFLSPARAAELRQEYLGDRYDRLVSFVGRFVPYKGLDYLVEAIARLGDERTLFVLGGRGPLVEHVAALVRARGLTNVRLIGFVPDQDLVNLFRASDVVVSPSISVLESTPITLLYALAVGTPVVGSEIGGTGESVPSDGVHGVIVPIEDPAAIATALRRLFGVPRAHDEEARPRLWSDVAADYAGLFHQLSHLPVVRSPAAAGSPAGGALGSPITIRQK